MITSIDKVRGEKATALGWADKKSVSLVNFRLHFCCAQATTAQRPTGFMPVDARFDNYIQASYPPRLFGRGVPALTEKISPRPKRNRCRIVHRRSVTTKRNNDTRREIGFNVLTVSVSSSIRVPLNITPRPKNLSAHTSSVFSQLASTGARSGGARRLFYRGIVRSAASTPHWQPHAAGYTEMSLGDPPLSPTPCQLRKHRYPLRAQ